MTVDGAVSASGAMTGTNITGPAGSGRRQSFFGGQLQYYDEANSASYTIFNPSSAYRRGGSVRMNGCSRKRSCISVRPCMAMILPPMPARRSRIWTVSCTGPTSRPQGKITAATAGSVAPPEVVNQSWQAIAIAKLFRGMYMDLCVGNSPARNEQHRNGCGVFQYGGHVMEGELGVYQQNSGTPTAFRIQPHNYRIPTKAMVSIRMIYISGDIPGVQHQWWTHTETMEGGSHDRFR